MHDPEKKHVSRLKYTFHFTIKKYMKFEDRSGEADILHLTMG